jgi:hypothetical protein
MERPRRLQTQTRDIQSVDITTPSDRNGNKGRDRGGNITKRTKNYENQGRAIGTENESTLVQIASKHNILPQNLQNWKKTFLGLTCSK